MVKVNLLPSDLGRAKSARAGDLIMPKIAMLLLIINLTFFIAGLTLRLNTFFRKRGLSKVSEQYQRAENMANKFRSLKYKSGQLSAEISFLEGFLKSAIQWNEKLVELREIIPAEVWLRRLTYEKTQEGGVVSGKFHLQGGLVPRVGSSPLEMLSKFVNQIKENKDFSSSFQSPVFNSRTETYKNREIMAFDIDMPLKTAKP